jgi:hypothetical protein
MLMRMNALTERIANTQILKGLKTSTATPWF